MNNKRARQLRKNQTDAERSLWKHLRLRQVGGHKFRRQQIIPPYIVDFVCFEKRLIIEVDGGQHSGQGRYDSKRDEWLKAQGFSILKFWDNQVLEEIEAVKEVIIGTLGNRLYPPP